MLVMGSIYCKPIFLVLLLALLIPSGMAARQLPSDNASKGGIVKNEKVNAATTLTTAAQDPVDPHVNLNLNNPAGGIVKAEKATLTTAAQQDHINPRGNLNQHITVPALGHGHPGNPPPKHCNPYIYRRHCGPPDATP